MKHAKKILSVIAAVVMVMTLGMNVALGEPTPTATTASSPSPSPSPTDAASPGTSENDTSAQPTFTLLQLNSGDENVIRLQMRLRQLGYFNYRATGMYYNMTEKGIRSFQEQNELSADGQTGETTYNELFTIDAVRKPLGASVIPVSGPGMILDTPVYGELSSWEEVSALFPVGTTVTVTDFNTGYTFSMTRTGGENHADVESPDAANYSSYIKCFGDEPTWEKRAVLVTIGDTQYAASLFGNPNGEDTIAENTMAGHTELYFNGSTSDIFGFADRYHQEKVLTAANALS